MISIICSPLYNALMIDGEKISPENRDNLRSVPYSLNAVVNLAAPARIASLGGLSLMSYTSLKWRISSFVASGNSLSTSLLLALMIRGFLD